METESERCFRPSLNTRRSSTRLQVNEGRGGSNASKAAWRENFGTTIVEQVRRMGTVQTAQIFKTMPRAVNELQAGAAPQTMPITPVGGNGSGEGRERGATERSFLLRCTYSCHMVTCGICGRGGLRNLQVVMLSNVGMIVVLMEQRSSAAPSRGNVAAASIDSSNMPKRKRRTMQRGHLELCAIVATMLCFVSSMRQSSHGVL